MQHLPNHKQSYIYIYIYEYISILELLTYILFWGHYKKELLIIAMASQALLQNLK
jgi:hypothetical protein